jgi:hypothetical protein
MVAVLSSFPSWRHGLADPLVLPPLACGGLAVGDVHVLLASFYLVGFN